MIKVRILLVVAAMLFLLGANISRGEEISSVAEQIESDAYDLFVVNPEESSAILNKYKKTEKHYPVFKGILENSEKYNNPVVSGVIVISAILQDRRLLQTVKRLMDKAPSQNVDEIKFYFYRVGYNRDANFKYLKDRLDFLVQNPNDSLTLTYLPFLHDTDLAISYLSKLRPKADGAMSELLVWAADFMCYMNRDKKEIIERIGTIDPSSRCGKQLKERAR
jgi:hypothetical protein